MTKEELQLCSDGFVFIAARALLNQLKSETKIRYKFTGRPRAHCADPDSKYWKLQTNYLLANIAV